MKGLAPSYASGVAGRQAATSRNEVPLLTRLAVWMRVARDRRRLMDLDDTLLADMGVTREQAAREAARPFWDIDASAYAYR